MSSLDIHSHSPFPQVWCFYLFGGGGNLQNFQVTEMAGCFGISYQTMPSWWPIWKNMLVKIGLCFPIFWGENSTNIWNQHPGVIPKTVLQFGIVESMVRERTGTQQQATICTRKVEHDSTNSPNGWFFNKPKHYIEVLHPKLRCLLPQSYTCVKCLS